MKYRAEIDGLRAVAVVPVILFHAGAETFSGGFIGVDIFFVISGYLITTILLNEMQEDRFSLVNFYERRARRILPALFFVMLSCLPFAWLWLSPFALKEFFQSLVSVAFFSSNVFFFMKTGYFDTAAEMKPLLHTWSLAVEEQFYIFFPLLLMAVFARGMKVVVATLAVIFVVSLGLGHWGAYHSPEAAFFLLHTRCWELLLGAFCALRLNAGPAPANRIVNEVMSLAGLALILFAVFAFDKTTPTPSLVTLIPTGGVALIILFAHSGTLVQRLLALWPLVGIGLVSYSAYLWHQPLLVFYRVIALEDPSLPWMAVLVAATLALAYVTYLFVEQPFRNKAAWKVSRPAIFAFSTAGLVGFSVLGVAGHFANGFPDRNPQFLRLQQNYGLSSVCSGAPLDSGTCKTKPDAKVILWGDSHAMHLGQALKQAFPDLGVWQMTMSGCPPVPGYAEVERRAITPCPDYNDVVKRRLLEMKDAHDYTVVMSASEDVTAPPVRELFSATIAELKQRGFAIYFVSTTPRFPQVTRCIIGNIRRQGDFADCRFDLRQATNHAYFERMRTLASELGIGFVDLKDLFCETTHCGLAKSGMLLLRDNAHFSVEAASVLAAYIAPHMQVKRAPARAR